MTDGTTSRRFDSSMENILLPTATPSARKLKPRAALACHICAEGRKEGGRERGKTNGGEGWRRRALKCTPLRLPSRLALAASRRACSSRAGWSQAGVLPLVTTQRGGRRRQRRELIALITAVALVEKKTARRKYELRRRREGKKRQRETKPGWLLRPRGSWRVVSRAPAPTGAILC